MGAGRSTPGAHALVIRYRKNFPGEARARESNATAFAILTSRTGTLSDPGLPWGTYKVCAQRGSGSSTRRKYVNSVSVQDLSSGTSLTIDLTSGTESSSC